MYWCYAIKNIVLRNVKPTPVFLFEKLGITFIFMHLADATNIEVRCHLSISFYLIHLIASKEMHRYKTTVVSEASLHLPERKKAFIPLAVLYAFQAIAQYPGDSG